MFLNQLLRSAVVALCVALLACGDPILLAQSARQQDEEQAPKIPDDQLDSLVAPIALYPDPLHHFGRSHWHKDRPFRDLINDSCRSSWRAL